MMKAKLEELGQYLEFNFLNHTKLVVCLFSALLKILFDQADQFSLAQMHV
ncbi:MAG: hypothetical protein CM15mP32_2230 [Flavobacteriaceae bacterium]|nr:MAG: hypothetical protein CM15mP32_2230 [Flavobacteriaceae bacterium]